MHAYQVGDGGYQPEIDFTETPREPVGRRRGRAAMPVRRADWGEVNRLDEFGQRHLSQERILYDEVTKPPARARRFTAWETASACDADAPGQQHRRFGGVATGVQQGPGFTVESADGPLRERGRRAVQDSSDLESRQLAARESVLTDDLEPFVDQHRFEMRNVVGSGQGGRDGFGFGSITVANRLPHPEVLGEHGGVAWTGA